MTQEHEGLTVAHTALGTAVTYIHHERVDLTLFEKCDLDALEKLKSMVEKLIASGRYT